jgi:hypothetical protein
VIAFGPPAGTFDIDPPGLFRKGFPMSHDSLDSFREHVPDPGSTPQQHLAHTLACFSHVKNPGNLDSPIGPLLLLRRLDNADARAILEHLAAAHEPSDYAIRATTGVYGDGIVTGLTWGDVLHLLAQH